jgi:hypothetical protein
VAIEKPQRAEEICSAIVDHYEVEKTQCEADVLRFLNKLNDAGLIETTPDAA